MKFSQIKAEIEERRKDETVRIFEPDWTDLEKIYDLILEYKPLRVIEFGSGHSTYVIWAALLELGRGRLCALESDPLYYVNNRGRFEDFLARQGLDNPGGWPEVGDLIANIVFSPVADSSRFGMRFTYVPLSEPDFVYIDGPPSCFEKFVCDNIFDFHPLPKVILIDGREEQVATTIGILGSFYDVTKTKEPWTTVMIKKETLAEHSDNE